jgi:hypothetical protein
MRRTIFSMPAATAVAVLLGSGFAASNSEAAPIAGPGGKASFSGGGVFELLSEPPLEEDDEIEFTSAFTLPNSGTEEFRHLTTASGLVGLIFKFALGPDNAGQRFSIDYDRFALGVETGTLEFTLGNTTYVSIDSNSDGSIIEWDLAGTISMTDLDGYYDDASGGWDLAGTIGEEAIESTFSLTLNSEQTTGQEITAPATLALLGAGLLGLGVMVSRRFYG